MITQGPRFEWYQQVEGGDEPAAAPVLAQVPGPWVLTAAILSSR